MVRARPGALVAVLVLAAGCSFPDESYSRGEAIKVATQHFRGQDVEYYDVVSAGVGRDTIFVWLSALGWATQAQKRLARVLTQQGRGPLRLAISGPVPAKTYQILRGALDRSKGKDLKHVQILCIGRNSDRVALERAAAAAGAQLTLLPMSVLRQT